MTLEILKGNATHCYWLYSSEKNAYLGTNIPTDYITEDELAENITKWDFTELENEWITAEIVKGDTQ